MALRSDSHSLPRHRPADVNALLAQAALVLKGAGATPNAAGSPGSFIPTSATQVNEHSLLSLTLL